MKSKKIGDILAFRRESLSLNQQDVADMAGISAKTIYIIEHDKGNPSLQTLQKIMEVLGLEMKIDIKQVEE